MRAPRIRTRTAESRAEFERTLEDYLALGWRLVRRTPYSAEVRRRTWGRPRRHFLVFALGFWTLGLANLVYAFIAHARAERVLVRLVVSDAGYRADPPVAAWLPRGAAVRSFR